MTKDKGILIKNIYYMLSYAFQVLRQSDFENVATEDFDNIHDMFAAILSKGVARQLKQGLYREYITLTEDLPVMRGKLDISGTIRNKVQQKQRLSCEYDELSEDNQLNQILKTTMIILLRQDTVNKDRKSILKKELLFFQNVSMIEPKTIKWNTIRFRRNNQSYRMIINICNLVIQGLLLSTDQGEYKLATFIDEQRMCRLYEKFILEYYRYHHSDIQANADQIAWNLDDGIADFLPVMQTDITLSNGEKTLIIDAKYYAHTMQTRYDTQTLHSGNIYQIYTYVKNRDAEHKGNVAGMLLYAKTEEQIQHNNSFMMDGNQISVKTLDLGLPFPEIAAQLDEIVDNYF